MAALAASTKQRRRVSAIVAPVELHEAIATALEAHELTAADHVHELDSSELPVFGAEAVKGLEFDGVIVVNPHEILSEGTSNTITERGARLLYVAMTRAVQELHFVTDAEFVPLLRADVIRRDEFPRDHVARRLIALEGSCNAMSFGATCRPRKLIASGRPVA